MFWRTSIPKTFPNKGTLTENDTHYYVNKKFYNFIEQSRRGIRLILDQDPWFSLLNKYIASRRLFDNVFEQYESEGQNKIYITDKKKKFKEHNDANKGVIYLNPDLFKSIFD